MFYDVVTSNMRQVRLEGESSRKAMIQANLHPLDKGGFDVIILSYPYSDVDVLHHIKGLEC